MTKSAANVVSIAATSAASSVITAKSRLVLYSSGVRLSVMIAETVPSTVIVFWWVEA